MSRCFVILLVLASAATALAQEPAPGNESPPSETPNVEAAPPESSPSPELPADEAPENNQPRPEPAPARDAEEQKVEAQDWRFVGAFSIHGSLLSSVAGRSTLDLTYGAALRFGARHDANQFSLVVDYSGWQSLEDRSVITFATLNLAAEYTRTFFSNAVSTSLAAGPSILLTDTLLDDAGSVGLFVELRPAGFRWRTKNIVIGFDPLSFTLVAPVLGALPLVRLQYRTTLTLEFHP